MDAHITGLSAILAQGHCVEDAKPVAIASRTTNQAEKHYPQLDLEASSVDFGLRRFREYFVGAPHIVKVVTDHKPLQYIPYAAEYRKGKLNLADYMSRHAKPLKKLPKEEQKECDELNNLLYALHMTPVIDHLGLSTIAKATSADSVLSKIQKYVREGQTWIPKDDKLEIQKFGPILSELTLMGNGILLKDERMILPESLQETAIELAHRGAHPGQSGIERRLRYHFFFHNMFDKVQKFVRGCRECSVFVDKKTKEPINHHKVPERCWETVAHCFLDPCHPGNMWLWYTIWLPDSLQQSLLHLPRQKK